MWCDPNVIVEMSDGTENDYTGVYGPRFPVTYQGYNAYAKVNQTTFEYMWIYHNPMDQR